MKRLVTVCTMFLAALLAGCEGGPTQEEGMAPPPPSQTGPRLQPNEKILADFYKKSGLNEPLPASSSAMMSKPQADRLVRSVEDLLRLSKRAEQPEMLIDTVANELSAKIKEAEANKQFSFVQPHVDAYQVLRPDDRIFAPYVDRAIQELSRPRVALRGLYHDHNSGTTTAAVKVYNPLTRETTTENIRMGEAVKGIKFTRVIGKDEGIELELTTTGMVFQVLKGEDLK